METIYKWNFSDDKGRGKLWYAIAISFVIGISIWWILTKQYWLSFIIILISWIYFFIENNSSDEIDVEINELWIKIAWFFYDFSKIDKYSFIYNWEHAIILRLMLNKKWIKNIDLKINNSIYSELKQILPSFLEESENWELTTSEKFINLLKL
jgi:hypothetical protein